MIDLEALKKYAEIVSGRLDEPALKDPLQSFTSVNKKVEVSKEEPAAPTQRLKPIKGLTKKVSPTGRDEKNGF